MKARYPVIVAGRNPARQVIDACAEAGFELVANPQDMNPTLSRGLLEVVPLKKGSGTRGKILEAMAAGLPVVSTQLGCEGLGLQHDKHLLVANSASEFAEAIECLMNNESQRNQLSRQAHAKVQEFSYRAVAQGLLDEIRTDL